MRRAPPGQCLFFPAPLLRFKPCTVTSSTPSFPIHAMIACSRHQPPRGITNGTNEREGAGRRPSEPGPARQRNEAERGQEALAVNREPIRHGISSQAISATQEHHLEDPTERTSTGLDHAASPPFVSVRLIGRPTHRAWAVRLSVGRCPGLVRPNDESGRSSSGIRPTDGLTEDPRQWDPSSDGGACHLQSRSLKGLPSYQARTRRRPISLVYPHPVSILIEPAGFSVATSRSEEQHLEGLC